MSTNDNNKKGFGGFNDLVSDISKEVEVTDNKRPSTTSDLSQDSQPEAKQHQSSSVHSQNTTQAHNSTNLQSGGKGSKWGWWVAGIIFILVIYLEPGEKDAYNLEAPTVNEHLYRESNSSLTYSEESSEPEPKSTEVSNPEEIPPIGTGLQLSYNQVLYCLSEEVRLNTIQKSLDSSSNYEIDTFNSAIQDYNSRCSNFKYRSGLLERVQSQVSLNHAILIIEGLTTLDNWRVRAPTPIISDPPVNLAPQSKLAQPKNNTPEIQATPEDQSANSKNPDSTLAVTKKYSNLFAAVQSGDIEATEHMLNEGANINPVDDAHPPLIAAIYIDNSAMVELLLNHGANPNSKNSRGESAMMIAKTQRNPNKEIIGRLNQAGAMDPFGN